LEVCILSSHLEIGEIPVIERFISFDITTSLKFLRELGNVTFVGLPGKECHPLPFGALTIQT
jgi:hypothetical protein